MKLCRALALYGLMLSCLLAAASVPAVPLVEQGKSDYHIYSSPSATAAEQYAASVLQDYVARISGCTLPIVSEMDEKASLIYVGFHDAPAAVIGDLDPTSFGKEEYTIQAAGDDLLIAGRAPRG